MCKCLISHALGFALEQLFNMRTCVYAYFSLHSITRRFLLTLSLLVDIYVVDNLRVVYVVGVREGE